MKVIFHLFEKPSILKFSYNREWFIFEDGKEYSFKEDFIWIVNNALQYRDPSDLFRIIIRGCFSKNVR